MFLVISYSLQQLLHIYIMYYNPAASPGTNVMFPHFQSGAQDLPPFIMSAPTKEEHEGTGQHQFAIRNFEVYRNFLIQQASGILQLVQGIIMILTLSGTYQIETVNISKITFAMFPFYQKKKTQNCILSSLE